MPIRSGAAPARPKYLFAERGSPYEITLMLADWLKKELAAIPQDVLLKSSPAALTDEIVQRYTLNVPIIDGAVVLTHTAKDPVPEAVNKEFHDRMNRIETALQFSRDSVSEWNNRLMNLVKPEVEKRFATIERTQSMTLGYQRAAAPVEKRATPAAHTTTRQAAAKYDVFLSHASEDKDDIARPLHEAMKAEGVSVWFDEAVLKMGDSLSGKIDEGLARCGHGIVIISPNFLAKGWPKKELAGLVAREMAGGKTVILPIWHNIDHATLLAHSPTLADKVAGRSSDGIPALIKMILDAIR